MLTALRRYIDFFCLTLHKTTLYPKTFFKTKRAMQNSLCLIVDSNCRARDEISLSGHAEISAKASTTVNCKFEKSTNTLPSIDPSGGTNLNKFLSFCY